MNIIAQSLLGEYDHEVSLTRKVLARIPQDKLDFRPHPKSMTMGNLAAHVANMHNWGVMTLQTESLDLHPPGGEPLRAAVTGDSQEAIHSGFEKWAAEFRLVLAGYPDDKFLKPWSLLVGGKEMFTMSRIAVVRGMVLNHIVHHRAQLCLYLRLNDIPVPSIYGPSADEQK